jgi:hypothetical protein
MTDRFAPAEPLDIAKLNAMDDLITKLRGQLEQFTQSQSLEDKTIQKLVVRAGSTGQDIVPEFNKPDSVTVSFGYAFKAGTSPYVTVTPYGIGANSLSPLVYFVGGGYNNTQFNIRYYLSSGSSTATGTDKSVGKMGFNWVAVGEPA